MKRFLTSFFSFLSLIGAGINVLTLSQIKSQFEKVRQDKFLKQEEESGGNSLPSYSPWTLIYTSGSFSFLKRFMDQIISKPQALKLAKTDTAEIQNTAETYPRKMKALIAKFLKDLDYLTLISPIEVSEQDQNLNTTTSNSEKDFSSFKRKFSAFNSWLELGIVSLVLEALFLLILLSSSCWFWNSFKGNRREKLKQLAFFYLTNIVGYAVKRIKDSKTRSFLIASEPILRDQFSGIKVSKLNYSTDGEAILKDINLTIRKGEFYAIIGPNGAGKTTLLKNLAGLLTPESGKLECSIMKEGESFFSYNSFWKSAVYIPQELNIQGDTSVYDFLLYSRFIFLRRLEGAKKEDHIHVLNALKVCGLQTMRYSRMGELSGGQKQKVILASIIVRADADLILLDEPTTHLDLENRNFLLSFFKELSKAGKTIIANLHNFVEISELATQIIALKGGRVEGVGEKQNVLIPSFLNYLYDLELSDKTWERFCSTSSFNY